MASSFDITEPLTKRLRGLLREYPPGTTVLRELLQNADDAGAHKISYIVDTNTYPTVSLVDPSLAAYQGPALLVHNDSRFAERDFESLRKLGDSNKLQQRTATGKFGLGFSSVYGWTDSPQILTGGTFVALSPHYGFQREQYRRSNGIRLDGIPNSGFGDSLAAFARAPGAGTIIRIPLRTGEQAARSEITQLSVSAEDILSEFAAFQNEVGESLLFLKNVERIEFGVNGQTLGSVAITNDVRSHRAQLRKAIESERETTLSFTLSLHHEFTYKNHSTNRSQTYQILHKLPPITSLSLSPEFTEWTKNESLFPWIALAAPLSAQEMTSRLFVSLPLPIFWPGNRVHIHGLFALSRDRRSLWTAADVQSAGKPTRETEWNELLFRRVIPGAWAELLEALAETTGVGLYFPSVEGGKGSFEAGLLGDVLACVVERDEAVWYAVTGEMVRLSEGIVSLSEVQEELLDALAFMNVPLIHGLPAFLAEALRAFPFNEMSPQTIRAALRANLAKQEYDISVDQANILLEYIISDSATSDLCNIPLFMCDDTRFRALTKPQDEGALWLTTPQERHLFPFPERHYLSPSLPESVRAYFRGGHALRKETSLRVFGNGDFVEFLRRHGLKDGVVRDGERWSGEWTRGVWEWIEEREGMELLLDGARLIPVEGGEMYPVRIPCGKPVLRCTGGIISEIWMVSGGMFPLLEMEFTVREGGILERNQCVVGASDLGGVLGWITPEVVQSLPDCLRDSLRGFLAALVGKRDGVTEEEIQLMRELPIFEAVTATQASPSPVLTKSLTAFDSDDKFIAISDIAVVPIVERTVFLNGTTDGQFLSRLGFPPIAMQRYLQTVVCANIASQPDWLLDPLITHLFDNVTLNQEWCANLRHVPFVRVQSRSGTASTRCAPSKVIDSGASIAGLYFDDEEVFPVGVYEGKEYTAHLRMLGMKDRFDDAVADERIRTFKTRRGDESLYAKTKLLLELLSDRTACVPFHPEWLEKLLLPAISEGKNVVLGVEKCRYEKFRPLVDGVMGILSVQIRDELGSEFGWDGLLDPSILAARIDVLVADPPTVEAKLAPILEYVKTVPGAGRAEYVRRMREGIKSERIFPGTVDGLWSGTEIFFRDAGVYEPYFSTLPRSYVRDFAEILNLWDIGEFPSTSDLLSLLSTFPTDSPLAKTDLDIVLRILEAISRKDVDPKSLLIPDTNGILHRLAEFISTPTLFGHPNLSPDFAFKFQIPQIGDDTAFIKHLATTDVQDYFQQEDMTTRIHNTLKDYSLQTTFNEFVANAEDSGTATKITWLLDCETTRFPTANLFSPELAEWQSPGLYVYNDGVFSEADFAGLIKTGAGTKAQDRGKIGRYGLGSLTMFHFTDVPTMVSGQYFVIFDPARRYLPVDERGRRRAGMKIPLSLMKGSKRGHLLPFDGIGGFSLEINRFEGTIFRLPLRTAAQAQSSSLVGNRNFLEYADLWQQLDKDYFEQAKKSLALLTNLEEIEFRTCALEPGNDSEIKRRFQYRWTVGIKEESLIEAGPDSCLDEMPIENLRISYFDVSYRSAPSPWSSVDNWLVVSAFLSKDAFEQSCSLKDIPQKVFASGDDGSIPAVAVAVQLNNKPLRNGNFYSSLPLPAPTGLPIHCHGHFAMSSDRRSFRIDGEAGKWNRYLAEQCLPHLYFALLEQLCLRETANYYAYWPKGNASNVISNDLVSSFWKNIPQSSRQVVFAPNGVALPLCYTILDGRVIPPINGIVIDPITNFVQASCPEHTVIHEPVLNAGLLYRPDELVNFRLTFDQSLSVLTPAFVGELLRKKYAITILKSSTLHSLRKILDFVMEPDDKSLERILGCYILRLANGDLVRLTRRDPESKVFYLSDQEGFGLFNPLAPDRFIDPAAVCRRNWSFDGEKYNVQSLNGPIIDDLICNSFPAELIQTGKPPETTFIRRLWEYVTKKKFQVTFWQTRAMLPLQHDISTFISMKAWDKLPVMPPNIPEDMAKVCCSLKIHILRTIELPAVVALEQSTKIPRDERFLECILRSQGNSIDKLAGIQFKLQDVYILQQFAVKFVKSSPQRSPSASLRPFQILRQLPLWQSACSDKLRVRAFQSIILPKDAYIDELTPARLKGMFINESADTISAIVSLGGMKIDTATYALTYVLQHYNPSPNKPVNIVALEKLLLQLRDCRESCNQIQKDMIKHRRLIPDQHRFPHLGRELYSRSNRIFAECFKDDVSAFPHPMIMQRFPDDVLCFFGVQTKLTKANLFASLARLESAIDSAAGEDDVRDVISRCRTVWNRWVELSDQLQREEWSVDDFNRLLQIRCVPAYKAPPTPRYRAKFLDENHDKQIYTLAEICDPDHISICWTQCKFAATKPPKHVYFGHCPLISMVVEHLVMLTTHISKVTTIENKPFFVDLLATYEFIAKKEHMDVASKYIKSQHPNAKIWLNDDVPLSKITCFVQARPSCSDKPISSLTWLASSSILHGVSYDLPSRGMYAAKASLEPYSTLLRACGSRVVSTIKAVLQDEKVEDHGQLVLQRLRSLRDRQPSLSDIQIEVEGKVHYAHRIILASISSYFRGLFLGKWKEKDTGVLKLDEEAFGTSASVTSVLEWAYNGFIELDDGMLKKDDVDQVRERLDHYIDCLELGNAWNIPEFQSHVENRILKFADLFVRIENVSRVHELACRYQAEALKGHCLLLISANKDIVNLVDNTKDEE